MNKLRSGVLYNLSIRSRNHIFNRRIFSTSFKPAAFTNPVVSNPSSLTNNTISSKTSNKVVGDYVPDDLNIPLPG